jgi:hypothetical protein
MLRVYPLLGYTINNARSTLPFMGVTTGKKVFFETGAKCPDKV